MKRFIAAAFLAAVLTPMTALAADNEQINFSRYDQCIKLADESFTACVERAFGSFLFDYYLQKCGEKHEKDKSACLRELVIPLSAGPIEIDGDPQAE